MLTISKLTEYKDLFNIKYLSEQSNVNYGILRHKIRNNRELSVVESQNIENYLNSVGITFNGNN